MNGTITSFIRNRNKLFRQLLLLNLKVQHSHLLKKINHGGCGLFACLPIMHITSYMN